MKDNRVKVTQFIQADSLRLEEGPQLILINPNQSNEEVIIAILEVNSKELNHWVHKSYGIANVNIVSPDGKLGLFSYAISGDRKLFLSHQLAVISKQGVVYELLKKLSEQVALHIVVFDQSGRSVEYIEVENPYSIDKHGMFDRIQDIPLSGRAETTDLMDLAFDLVSEQQLSVWLQEALPQYN